MVVLLFRAVWGVTAGSVWLSVAQQYEWLETGILAVKRTTSAMHLI